MFDDLFLDITVAGFYILIRSDYVKAKFRQNPHDPYFAGRVFALFFSVEMILNSVNCVRVQNH